MRESKARKIARKVSGFLMVLFFIMVLGKAGASDNGAEIGKIFPAAFIYTGLAAICFEVWDKCGGNDPAVIYNNEIKSLKRNEKFLEKTLDFLVIVCYTIYIKRKEKQAEIRNITIKSNYYGGMEQ